MANLVNRWVEIQGYKHDGRMHRIWDSVFVVEETNDYIVVCSKKTKVIEHDFRVWYTKEPAVMIFFKKRWYNVIAMLKKSGITYYVNIASPYIIDKEKIKYIDYDLDLKFYPNQQVKVIDVKEYGYHSKKYGYSEDISKILRFNLKELPSVMKSGEFPFKNEKIIEFYEVFSQNTEKKEKDE